MSTTSKFVITMLTPDGDKNFTYNYADPDCSTQRMKALCAALVANGSIFLHPPTEAKAAIISTTETLEFDLSD